MGWHNPKANTNGMAQPREESEMHSEMGNPRDWNLVDKLRLLNQNLVL